ncbi:MAG: hypothetical protein Q9227_001106 [Pyrenula ochraceoflavens]
MSKTPSPLLVPTTQTAGNEQASDNSPEASAEDSPPISPVSSETSVETAETAEEDGETSLNELVNREGEDLLSFVDDIRKIDGLGHVKLDLPQRCLPNGRPGYKITVRDPTTGKALYPKTFPKVYANVSWSDVYRQLKKDIAEAFEEMESIKCGTSEGSRPREGHGHKDQQRSKLKEDIMTIEVSKPNQAHFSVVDIPGLVNNSPKDDVELSEKLARKYINNKRAIVLAVFSGIDAIENQGVERLVREAGAIDRCIGVITKCDAVQEGDEGKVLQTIEEPSRIGAQLGCYAVRNRTTNEIKMSPSSLQDRDDRERAFFFDEVGWQNALNRRSVGVKNLRAFLARTLHQQVMESFPGLQNDIKRVIKNLRKELGAMGMSRDTREAQLSYLLGMQQAYTASVDSSLNGDYGATTSDSDASKLRLNVRRLDENFNREMRSDGLTHRFRLPQEDSNAFRNVADFGQLKEKMLREGGTYAWILKTCELLVGPEPPLDFPTRIKQVLFEQQTLAWSEIATEHVDRVIEVINRFNASLFAAVCSEPEIRQRLRGELYEAETNAKSRARKELASLLNDQKQRLHTNDPRLEMQSVEASMLRLQSDVKFMEAKEPSTTDNLAKYLHINKCLSSRVYELHDYLKVYCDVAMSRFIDNVGMQVIERHLLGSDGPLRVFRAQWIASMSSAKLDALVGESEEMKSSRTMLERNIETLSIALKRSETLNFVIRVQISSTGVVAAVGKEREVQYFVRE